MSGKRGRLTVDKARERINSLEESIRSREQKLQQLRSRLSRSSSPEEKLIAAEHRLERRLKLERDQVLKLKRLLSRRAEEPSQESGEYSGSEELDELHRSFEEVRQDLTQVKRKLEGTELPRDLPSRLSAFEERISRREEADSGLFSQLMDLQAAIEAERQTLRKLSRRNREQDQSLEALREAVEDSVVATVDLAERLDELEESLNEQAVTSVPEPQQDGHWDELKELVARGLLELEQKLTAALERLEDLETRPRIEPDQDLYQIREVLHEYGIRLQRLEHSLQQAVARPQPQVGETDETRIPARFSSSGNHERVVAQFSKAALRP